MCPADTNEVCHVATNLPANQSSVYEDYGTTFPASYAVDSHRHTDPFATPRTCSVTANETNPWWVVDLGVPLTVTGVFFTNVDHKGASTVAENAAKTRLSGPNYQGSRIRSVYLCHF